MIKLKTYETRSNRVKYLPPHVLIDSDKIYPAFCKIVKPHDFSTLINQLLKEIDIELRYINNLVNGLIQDLININLRYVVKLKQQLIDENTSLKSLKSQLDPCSQSVSEVNSLKSQITKQKTVITDLETLISDYENMDVLTTEAQLVLTRVTEQIDSLKEAVNVKIRKVNELGDLDINEV